MKEEEPVITPLLGAVVKQFKNQNIVVVNDRSSREALLPLDDYKKISAVDCEDVLEVLNQKNYLKFSAQIICLTEKESLFWLVT